MLLSPSPLVRAIFALLAVVIVGGSAHTHHLWRRARHVMSWDWTNDPEIQSRWLDFATPMLPWDLRRAYMVATVWLCAAFTVLGLLIAALSTSLQGAFFAGWCLILATGVGWDATRVARSKHQSLPRE
jgi:hypothetical protein